MDWLAQWWDAVELWLVQLPVALQFPVVMVVILPMCLGVARLVDRVADWGAKVDDVAVAAEPEKVNA